MKIANIRAKNYCVKNTLKTPFVEARFIVKQPFRNDVLNRLGDSYSAALKRFYSLERKLERNPTLRQNYISFMEEYIALGHLQKVDSLNDRQNAFYLPHHAVIREESVTTKLRVVFDASTKSDSNVSLNDTLMIGPMLQEDLFSNIFRFRHHKYALTADVCKMYRQVRVAEEQTRYQRILWRTNPSEGIATYELKTVTYRTASASFLAVRCLQQLAREAQDRFPVASEIILKDFYMDALLTGAGSIEEAIKLRDR